MTKKIKKSLKKKQNGGDTVCSNLYPKLNMNDNLNISNEVIGGPSSVNSDNTVLSCSIPTPRAPISDVPVSPMTEKMPMSGSPSIFDGKVPPRVSPKITGPPGPGNYQLGPEGIYVSSPNEIPPQATSILHDLVNKGTVNRDYQPILNTNLVNKSTCKSFPSYRNQSGGGTLMNSYKKTPKKVLKSSKLLKEREKKLNEEKEKRFIIGLKRELSVEDFRKVLVSLDIDYSEEMNLEELYQLLKKRRPDLVHGSGWFYLMEIMRAVGVYFVCSSFISLLFVSIPFFLITSIVQSEQDMKKTKKKIKKIVDSK